MACKKCEHIAVEIECQGCTNDIFDECTNGNCEADEILERGSVNGHPVAPFNEETIGG